MKELVGLIEDAGLTPEEMTELTTAVEKWLQKRAANTEEVMTTARVVEDNELV